MANIFGGGRFFENTRALPVAALYRAGRENYRGNLENILKNASRISGWAIGMTLARAGSPHDRHGPTLKREAGLAGRSLPQPGLAGCVWPTLWRRL